MYYQFKKTILYTNGPHRFQIHFRDRMRAHAMASTSRTGSANTTDSSNASYLGLPVWRLFRLCIFLSDHKSPYKCDHQTDLVAWVVLSLTMRVVRKKPFIYFASAVLVSWCSRGKFLSFVLCVCTTFEAKHTRLRTTKHDRDDSFS